MASSGEAALLIRRPPSPRFLLPRASGHRVLPALPPLPPHDLVLDGETIMAEFDGWADPTDPWRQWVAKLRPLHEPLWRELGILEGIVASTCRVRRGGERALLQLLPFWCPLTNTFVFPWGEATVTLEDVAVLAGLPVLGAAPVREPARYSYSTMAEMADEHALAVVRAALLLADADQGQGAAPAAAGGGDIWAEHFLPQPQHHRPGGGRGERRRREHVAFLATWLTRFVLPAASDDVVVPPGPEVLDIAARLARGRRVALAPAALASIYAGLSALHRHFVRHRRTTAAPSVSAPFHILQLWVWERFPELRPAPAPAAAATAESPRAARWHDVHRAVDPGYARAVFWAPREFQWMPYGSSYWARARRGDGGAASGDAAAAAGAGAGAGGSRAACPFARCVQACELVGVDDVEQYNPHRVARQLGFDQDVPGTVTRLNTNIWERAWETYDIAGAQDYAFAIPSDEPGVTEEYAQWWGPYSELSGAVIAAAAAADGGDDDDDVAAADAGDDANAMILDGTGNGANNEGSSSGSGPWAAVTMEMMQRSSTKNRQAESRELFAKLMRQIQGLDI